MIGPSLSVCGGGRTAWSIGQLNPKLWLSAARGIGTCGSRLFDGVDQKFILSASPAYGTGSYTIEFWAKVGEVGREQYCIGTGATSSSYPGVRIGTTTQNRWRMQMAVQSTTVVSCGEASGTTVVGNWYHVVGIVNRTTNLAYLYVNGALRAGPTDISSLSNSLTMTPGATRRAIGGNYTGTALFVWNGSICKVRIACGYLYTAADIAETYNLGNGKYQSELSSALAANITHSWNMNEASGSAIDSVGTNDAVEEGTDATIASNGGPREAQAADLVGGYHGRLTNMDTVNAWSTDVPAVASCEGGYSLTFDGSDDYVTCGDVLDIGTSDFTLAAWIKTTSNFASPGAVVMGKADSSGLDGRYALRVVAGAAYALLDVGSSVTVTGSAVNDGAWHHIAATYDRDGLLTLYIDGASSGTPADISAGSATSYNNTFAFMFGANSVPDLYYAGKIDDARMYMTCLSAADVAILAAGNEPTTAPTAHWTCDDGPQYGEPSDGDPICTWESREGTRYQLNQATASARPIWRASSIGAESAVDFDGTASVLKATAAILSGTAGHCFIVGQVDAAADAAWLSQADEAAADAFLQLGATAAGNAAYSQNNGGTADTLTGDSALGTDAHIFEWSSDGSTVALKVDGVAQSLTVASGANNGDWAGDVTGADNAILGAIQTSGGLASYLNGKIAEVVAWDAALASGDATKVRASLASKYGITL